MGRKLSSRIFQVTNDLTVVCDCEDTRSGFRHLAYVLRGGWCVNQKPVKICYLNRTWEAFEFQSVLHKLADSGEGLSDEERTAIRGLR